MNLYMEVLKMRIDLPNPKEFSGLFAKLLKIEYWMTKIKQNRVF